MTLARAFGSGLSSLTALNRQLVAAAASEDESPAEEQAATTEEPWADDEQAATTEEPWWADDEPVGDPDADDEETADTDPEVRGRFSVEDPWEFQRVKEWIEQSIFGGSATGLSPIINAFVNEWDIQYRRDQGMGPTENIGSGATLEQLLQHDAFVNGALWLPLTATQNIPAVFESTTTSEEGTVVPAIAMSDPLTGVEFVEINDPVQVEQAIRRRPARFMDAIRRAGTMATDAIARDAGISTATDPNRARFEEGTGQVTTPAPSPTEQNRMRFEAGTAQAGQSQGVGGVPLPDYIKTALRQREQTDQPQLPFIPQDDLLAALQPATTGSGRRSGGGTRRELVFDKDHLIKQVADRWDAWMFTRQEAPEGQVNSWVDGYIREAKAFWVNEGGQLDFDTYVTNKMEQHPRYQTIYRDKLPGESPEQFLQKFYQPIAAVGLNQADTHMQTERALTSNTSPQAQARRVSRTREAYARNQGTFSQRFAETLRGVGYG